MPETFPLEQSINGSIRIIFGSFPTLDFSSDPTLTASVRSVDTLELAASQTALKVSLSTHVNQFKGVWIKAKNNQSILVGIDQNPGTGPHVPTNNNMFNVGPLGCAVIFPSVTSTVPDLYLSNPDGTNTAIVEIGTVGSWTT